jgi:hypothetical protein
LCCTVFTIVFIKDKRNPVSTFLVRGKGRKVGGEGALQESLVEYCYDIFKKPKKYFPLSIVFRKEKLRSFVRGSRDV